MLLRELDTFLASNIPFYPSSNDGSTYFSSGKTQDFGIGPAELPKLKQLEFELRTRPKSVLGPIISIKPELLVSHLILLMSDI